MPPWLLPLLAGIAVLLLLCCFSWDEPRAVRASAQWSHAVWNLDEDAERFYKRLERLLDKRLEKRPLPLSRLVLQRRQLCATRTIFGGNSVYLQASYRHLTYYVYAFPMPGGLFVSTWLFSRMAGWEERPLLRWLLWRRLTRLTLFGYDCLEMFHFAVHGALLDVLDDYARERGLPPLDEVARRPVLHGFYARSKGQSPSGAPSALAAPWGGPADLPFEEASPTSYGGPSQGPPSRQRQSA